MDVALRLAFVGLFALAAACARGPEHPNVVLVVIDTLRADALGAYGRAEAPTPHLDRLAGDGVVFTSARATAPWTVPSIASLLTSRYPSEHGEGAQRAPDAPANVPTLAEVLRDVGWRTAAFVEAPLLHRGFETFEIPTGDLESRLASRNGAAMTFGYAIDWLLSTATEPFLLVVHTFEVHDYFAAKDYQRAFAIARHPTYRGRFLDWAIRDNREGLGTRLIDELLAAAPDDIAFLRSLYAAAVAAVDTEFARLDAALDQRGLRNRTLVVVTADHGEGFAPERRRVHHAGRLHDDLLAVPLLLRWPGRVPVAREDRRVTTLDVMPTVLALAGVPPPAALRGESLLAPARGLARLVGADFRLDVRARPSVAEESSFLVDASGRRHVSTVQQAAIVGRGLKLITAGDVRELYAPREDPEERTNLVSVRAAQVEILERKLGRILPHLGAAPAGMRPETARELRALGYLQ